MEKFVCDACGCSWEVEDRNNFSCPNCIDKIKLKYRRNKNKKDSS
jgi:rubrerythrin